MSRRMYASSLAGAPDSTKLVKHKLDELEESHEEYNASTFGGFTDYMRRKKVKLQNQDALKRSRIALNTPPIFAGMTIHINGYTRPGRVDLWNMIVEHGGVYKQYLEGKTDVTHIVASNLTKRKQADFARYRVIRPEWIVDSIRAQRSLPWSDYRLIEAGHNQKTLEQTGLSGHERDSVEDGPAAAYRSDSVLDHLDQAAKDSSCLLDESVAIDGLQKAAETASEINDSTQSLPGVPTTPITNKSPIDTGRVDTGQANTGKVDTGQDTGRVDTVAPIVSNGSELVQERTSKMATKTAKDPDFIQDYFRNSRLHHLSHWKANLRLKIDNLAKQSGLNVLPRTQRYVMHVDFDCFFAAVSALHRTDLVNKACAVTHGGSNSGEIASCNYKAREYGVKNGMWMKEAVKICPDIVSLPYDFKAYEAASDHFYEVLLALKPSAIEAVSIDEALLDITNLVQDTQGTSNLEVEVTELATRIRDAIRFRTGVEVSVGVGANVLQAKLAIKKAKPAGQFYMAPNNVLETLDHFSVHDLPGVGFSTATRLKEHFDVDRVASLRQVSQGRLQEVFGPKTGVTLSLASRGEDDTVVGDITQRKLVSIEINWGIRLDTKEEVADYMRRVSEELCRKLHDVGFSSAQHLLVKVMRRSQSAPVDPPKFLGHGPCDKINTGREIPLTGDPEIVWKHALALLEALAIPPNELRGIGVALTKLQSTNSVVAQGQGSVANYFHAVTSSKGMAHCQVDPVDFHGLKIQAKLPSSAPDQSHVVQNQGESPAADLSDDVCQSVSRQVRHATQFLIPSQIDKSVLADLPEQIRQSILDRQADALQSASEKGETDLYVIPRISQIDPADLAALPTSIRHDLILQGRQQLSSPTRRKITGLDNFVIKTPSPKKQKATNNRYLNTLTQTNFLQRPVNRSLLPELKQAHDTELILSSSPSADIDRDVLSVLPKEIRLEVVAEDRNRRMAQRLKEQRKLQVLSRLSNVDSATNASGDERERRTIVLPEIDRISQFGDLGTESITSLRTYLATWVQGETGEGPDETDLQDFKGYLHLLVASERDLERAEQLLRWMWMLVTKNTANHIWVQSIQELIESVNLLLVRQGLGEFQII